MLNKLKDYIFKSANVTKESDSEYLFKNDLGYCELSFYMTKKKSIYQFQITYNKEKEFENIFPKSENIFIDLTTETTITVTLSDSKYTIESDKEYFSEYAKICRELFQSFSPSKERVD